MSYGATIKCRTGIKVVITLFAGISMKIIFRGFCTLFALSFSYVAMAGTTPPYGEDAPNPEMKSMAFAQCVEIIRDYENDLGPAKVVIDTPELRIVRFTTDSENEQIACDGDDGIMTVFDLDDD